jgi:hypothetical protein
MKPIPEWNFPDSLRIEERKKGMQDSLETVDGVRLITFQPETPVRGHFFSGRHVLKLLPEGGPLSLGTSPNNLRGDRIFF